GRRFGDKRRIDRFCCCPDAALFQAWAHQVFDSICELIEHVIVETKPLGCILEASSPVAREKTFTGPTRNRIETGSIFKEGLLRLLRATGGETTVGQSGEISRNLIAFRFRAQATAPPQSRHRFRT